MDISKFVAFRKDGSAVCRRLEKIEWIGGGSFCEVYLVCEVGSEMHYLLKLYSSNGGVSRRSFERLEENNRLFNDNQHNNLQRGTVFPVKLYHLHGSMIFAKEFKRSGKRKPREYRLIHRVGINAYLSNYDDGVSLEKYAETNKLSLKELVSITIDLLEFVKLQRNRSENSFIHYDIKEGNVVVNRVTGKVMNFIDFGSALTYAEARNRIRSRLNIETTLSNDNDNEVRVTWGYFYDVRCALCVFKNLVENTHKLFYTSQTNLIDVLNSDCKSIITSRELENKDSAEEYSEEARNMLNSIAIVEVDDMQIQVKKLKENIGNYDSKWDNALLLSKNGSEPSENGKYSSLNSCLDDILKTKCIINCGFFRERRELGKFIISKADEKNYLPAMLELKNEDTDENAIKRLIVSAFTGDKKIPFECFKDFLSNLTEESPQIVLIANIRSYNLTAIKNFYKAIKELNSNCEKFTYIILCDISISEGKIDEKDEETIFDGLTKYQYKFEPSKINANENEAAEPSEAALYKKLGGLYLCREFDNKRNSKTVDEYDKNLVKSKIKHAISAIDDEKYDIFRSLMYHTFHDFKDDGKPRKGLILESDIRKPLTQADIILIAERTGIITVTELSSSYDIKVRTENAEFLKELIYGQYAKELTEQTLHKYIDRLSEELLDEQMLNAIHKELEEIGGKNDRDKGFQKAAEILKPDFPLRKVFGHKGKGFKLNDSETILTINICNILSNDNGRKWKRWVKYPFRFSYDKESVDETTKAIKTAITKTRSITIAIIIAITIAIIALIIIVSYVLTPRISSSNKLPENGVLYLASSGIDLIFSSGWYEGAKIDLVEDTFGDIKSYIHNSGTNTLNISPSNVYTEPIHVTAVKINNKEHECNVWFLPDDRRVSVSVEQFPMLLSYSNANQTDRFQFVLRFSNDYVDFKVDEEAIKKCFSIVTTDGEFECEITETPTPYATDGVHRYEYAYVITARLVSKDGDENNSEEKIISSNNNIADAKLQINTTNVIEYYIDKSTPTETHILEVESDDVADFRLLSSINTIDVDTMLVTGRPTSYSASNAKYVVVEIDHDNERRKHYSIGYGDTIGFTEGIEYNDNDNMILGINNNVMSFKADAGDIAGRTLLVEYTINNSNGQYFYSGNPFDENNKVISTLPAIVIPDNGADYTPPQVELYRSDFDKANNKYTVTLIVTDDYPLPWLSGKNLWTQLIDLNCIDTNKKNFHYDITSWYGFNDNGLTNTCTEYIYLELTFEPEDNVDYIALRKGFIKDGAENSNEYDLELYSPLHIETLQNDNNLVVFSVYYPSNTEALNITRGHVGTFGMADNCDVTLYPTNQGILEDGTVNKYYDPNKHNCYVFEVRNWTEGGYLTVNGGTAISDTGKLYNGFRLYKNENGVYCPESGFMS